MLKDITLGQYYPINSIIHALDPRVKLFGTLIYIISLFLVRDIITFFFMSLYLIVIIILCKVPFSFMIKGLRAIMVLLFLAGFINIFMTPGEPIWSFGFLRITRLGIQNALLMVFRMIYLIIGSSIMTLTTTPNQLTDGLEKSLHFLTALHVPVHEIAMIMSIALRFIPILTEETDKIIKAQKARGADFENGGLMTRAKSLVPILVPLFVSAFRRANDLALAMEARCYNGGNRTRMKPLTYEKRDYIAYIFIFLSLITVILLKIIF